MMELFLGTFEKDWERRRAALLHECQIGNHEDLDWGRPRRGGQVHAVAEAARRRLRSDIPLSQAGTFRGDGVARPMFVRFAALASGSQPVVVKVGSYGGGVRVAAMMNYVSRGGELCLEDEKGKTVSGKAELSALRSDWEHLFVNRTSSRDVGMFEVMIADRAFATSDERNEFVGRVLRAGFGGRRLVYAVCEGSSREHLVRGVLVLRERSGERLSADTKAADLIQQRFDNSDVGHGTKAHFRFQGYGNGVEFATARVRELVGSANGNVWDETGRAIRMPKAADDLVQKEWRRELHSRKGRDVMHLIVSARAGTDVSAFGGAVRDFLGEQFYGSRYLFALHDPALDTKDIEQGGKRPHIHAHAIITMLSETGQRIETSPAIFRRWRELMAQKGREHGIDMELTDRRDRASPPAYSRNQVRPISYHGRTEHEGTSPAAQMRYEAKRKDEPHFMRSRTNVAYAYEAARAWKEVVRLDPRSVAQEFADRVSERLQMSSSGRSQNNIDYMAGRQGSDEFGSNLVELSRLIARKGAIAMQAMTRSQFEAHEKRVEALLANVGASIEVSERKDFEEIAAAAREVVSLRREYLRATEQELLEVGTAPDTQDRTVAVDRNASSPRAVASQLTRYPGREKTPALELSHTTESALPGAKGSGAARSERGGSQVSLTQEAESKMGDGRLDERER